MEIVADCPFLQVFSGTSYTETETKLSVRHFVEQIIQILIKSVTTEQREQLISWLIDLCHHHVMQNISCLMCQENESIATLCFLYIFFSSTTTTEGNDDMLHKQVCILSFIFIMIILFKLGGTSVLKHQGSLSLSSISSILFPTFIVQENNRSFEPCKQYC